jgi:hypothetical protein
MTTRPPWPLDETYNNTGPLVVRGDGAPADPAAGLTSPPGLPASIPYGLLSSEHPHSLAERGYTPALWRELDLLYRGGYAIQEAADEFLPACLGEHPARYQERLKLSAYIGYFGQIVGSYTAALFAQPVSVTPDVDSPQQPERAIYDAFARNADLRGGTFADTLRALAIGAFVKGKALCACDFPAAPPGVLVVSKADSERLGLARPYAYTIEPEELIDWEYDEVVRRRVELRKDNREIGAVEFDVGRFSWVVLRRVVTRRAAPTEARGLAVEEYKVWIRDEGGVRWALYRTPPIQAGRAIDPRTPIERVDQGSTLFREIPIVEIRLPDPLWIGNVVGPLNKEHWQRRSSLLAAQQSALLVIPTVNLAPEINAVGEALPAERATDPARGDDPVARFRRMGFVVLGEKDELSFKAPPTEAFTIVDDELKDLVDEMFRVTGRMGASVSSTAKAVGRSGESKAIDNHDFDTVCSAIGVILQDGARRIYDVVSDARGEDVDWTVHGLDRFDSGEDREEVLGEALQTGVVQLGSKTAMVEWKKRTIFRVLPGLSPEMQKTISDEVEASTTAEEEMRLLATTEVDETQADEDAEPADEQAREKAAGGERPVGAAA